MFKNLQLYRIAAAPIAAAELAAALAPFAFAPIGGGDMQSSGWVPPRPFGPLAYVVDKQIILTLRTDKKLLPASVVNAAAKVRAAEIQEQQGFAPGRKQFKEIKAQATDDLILKAFDVSQRVMVWIDPVHGWLAVDTPSKSKADDVLKMIIKCGYKFDLDSLRTLQPAGSAMTEWLELDSSPHMFSVDQDAELVSTVGGAAGSVRYANQSLNLGDVQSHIASGKRCKKLALTWNDRVSFVLTAALEIKRIAMLDILKERAGTGQQDDDERFDGDVVLATGEIAQLLNALVEALGGALGGIMEFKPAQDAKQ